MCGIDGLGSQWCAVQAAEKSQPAAGDGVRRCRQVIGRAASALFIEEQMEIKRYESGRRMSQAVVHGGFVFLAGQVADDTSQDVKGQTAHSGAQFM